MESSQKRSRIQVPEKRPEKSDTKMSQMDSRAQVGVCVCVFSCCLYKLAFIAVKSTLLNIAFLSFAEEKKPEQIEARRPHLDILADGELQL